MIDTSTYKGLVHKVAKRYKNCGIEYEELVGMGFVGLQIAAHKHDPKRGALGTIAPFYIKNEICTAIRKNKVYFNTYAGATAMDVGTGCHIESEVPVELSDYEKENISTPEYASPESLTFSKLDGKKVKSAVDKLKDNRKRVILQIYFNAGLASKRSEIAREMGISRQRVAEIEQQALRDLKQLLGL